jgi:hypothetical protein
MLEATRSDPTPCATQRPSAMIERMFERRPAALNTPLHRELEALANGAHRGDLSFLRDYNFAEPDDPPRLTAEGRRLLDALGPYRQRNDGAQ